MTTTQSVSEGTSLLEIEGVVKWFDPRKGYGFVVGPQGQDIFVHFSTIEQPEGFKTLKDGEKVVYSAAQGSKGWAASKVRALMRSGRGAEAGGDGDTGEARSDASPSA